MSNRDSVLCTLALHERWLRAWKHRSAPSARTFDPPPTALACRALSCALRYGCASLSLCSASATHAKAVGGRSNVARPHSCGVCSRWLRKPETARQPQALRAWSRPRVQLCCTRDQDRLRLVRDHGLTQPYWHHGLCAETRSGQGASRPLSAPTPRRRVRRGVQTKSASRDRWLALIIVRGHRLSRLCRTAILHLGSLSFKYSQGSGDGSPQVSAG